MSVAEVVKQLILDDVESRTFADVADANPDRTIIEDNLAPYHTDSIAKLLTGADDGEFEDYIQIVQGTHTTDDRQGIEICYLSKEAELVSAAAPDNDFPATEFARVSILCRITDVPSDGSKDDVVANLDMRIRYLLDFKIRELRSGGDDEITPDIDPEGISQFLDPDVAVSFHWLESPSRPDVRERVSVYRAEYASHFLA